MSWNYIRADEFCIRVTDGTHDSPKRVNDGKYLITSKHIKGAEIDYQSAYFISEDEFEKINQRSKVDQWDVIISMIGAYCGFCYIERNAIVDYAVKNVGLFKTGSKEKAEWLYYYLNSPQGQTYLSQVRTGSSQPYISLGELRKLPIPVPDDKTMAKICSVLDTIDFKIQNNTQINQNLLQQALCIYSALIDGKDKNGCIGDYCSIKSGFAFKSKWWQDSGIPVVKIGSISQDCLNLSDCSYVSEDKIELAKDYIVMGGDLLIAMTGATIGKFTMVPKTDRTILVNQRVGKFFLGKDPVQKIPFIYCTLKQPDVYSEVINRGQGSAQPNISASDIMSIPCVIPQPEEISRFNEDVSPIFEMIINNQLENSKLAKTRDTLLPLLMSGEIDVSEIDL